MPRGSLSETPPPFIWRCFALKRSNTKMRIKWVGKKHIKINLMCCIQQLKMRIKKLGKGKNTLRLTYLSKRVKVIYGLH